MPQSVLIRFQILSAHLIPITASVAIQEFLGGLVGFGECFQGTWSCHALPEGEEEARVVDLNHVPSWWTGRIGNFPICGGKTQDSTSQNGRLSRITPGISQSGLNRVAEN